ncbi:MAG: vWA domain-containing protein [Myxococcota bacterium]
MNWLAELSSVEARLADLWRDPASARSRRWIVRSWFRLRTKDQVLRADALRNAQVKGASHVLLANAFQELKANTELLERRARAGLEVDAAAVSWLTDVARWLRACERLRRRRAPVQQYALAFGLASRALHRSTAPTHVALTVDALLRAASDETEFVGRRIALVRAAQRQLLEAAAGEKDPSADALTEELLQLRRIASSLDPKTATSNQLGKALRRGDAPSAQAIAAARAYLGADCDLDDVSEAISTSASLTHQRDAEIDDAARLAVQQGFAQARNLLQTRIEAAPPMQRFRLQQRAADLKDAATESFVRMLMDAGERFDVGASLLREERLIAEVEQSLVAFPAAKLRLEPVGRVGELRDALIDDPRLLLYHLASRRLLRRAYVRTDERLKRRASVRAAVRFYLLDGSSSMRGPRGRMRDAILVAELTSLIGRLQNTSGRTRSLLYYRYFASSAEPARRVVTVPDAVETIQEVLASDRAGTTDIQSAMLDSVKLIAEQRDNDIELADATIFLVTDGQSEIDPKVLIEAQKVLDTPVCVNIVALGDDSPALRELSAYQRQVGLDVFYHHVSDRALREWEEDPRAMPAFAPSLQAPSTGATGFAALLEGTSDPALLSEALAELGLDESALSEAERVQLHARRAHEDRVALRFERYFPADLPGAETMRSDESLVVLHLLSTVSEVLELTPTRGGQLRADAIALLERLLRDFGLTEAEYQRILRQSPRELGVAVATVRSAVGSP